MTKCDIHKAHQEVFLEVPGKLECRNVVMRTVSAVCRSAGITSDERNREVGVNVLSAVGEAYNNIVLHGYSGRVPGSVQVKIRNCPKCVQVEIKDTGASFDPTQAPLPDLTALPESGLGIFLIRAMVDEVSYVAGSPNRLTMTKYLEGTDDDSTPGTEN
jgi:serine/threonine-protein kinase RsbW